MSAFASTAPGGNPSVNRYLDDKAIDHIDHALGRPVWPQRESYRNYFSVPTDSDIERAFEASPHWTLRNIAGDMAWYSVTDAGRKALADHLATVGSARAYVVRYQGHDRIVPASSPSKARYSYFLEVRDCLGDLSFFDFSKSTTVRLAP